MKNQRIQILVVTGALLALVTLPACESVWNTTTTVPINTALVQETPLLWSIDVKAGCGCKDHSYKRATESLSF